ncbi:MAG: hemolysin family protein [Methanomicrobiales archaeon]|nr:hemolysin family protein [Methanomicrobiales archaeon]
MDTTLKIFLFVICLILSGFFSGSEVVLTSVTRAKIKTYLKEGDRRATTLAILKKQMDHTLITILTFNNLVNVLAAALATSIAIDRFGEPGVGIATGVVVLLFLVFGEIGPKIMAVRLQERLALSIAPVIYLLSRLFLPLFWLYDRLNLSSPLTIAFTKPSISEDEIKSWIDLGREEGAIEHEEQRMLYSVLEFTDTIAREVMTPRPDVIAVEDTTKAEEVMRIFRETGLSRLPVYHDQLDNIVGVLYFKDVVFHILEGRGEVLTKDVMKEPFFVPENKKISDLLREMRDRRVHLGVVMDEYGSFAGVVTVEDILEELVGEIEDEFDREEPDVQRVGEGDYILDALIWVETVNERLGLNLPLSDSYDTVAGLVTERLGHIPKKGEQVVIPESGIRFIVIQTRGNRIFRLRMQLLTGETRDQMAGEGS